MQCYKWKTTRGTKYRREFERFYSCEVLWKALVFSRCHYACFCLVSLGKHIYLNSALIHFWWNQYAWSRKGIWWLDGVGSKVWSLKEGKNMCHIYTHYLTWQRSVLTTWTGLQNAGSQGSTQTTQFTEIPWSNPLKHATHLVHWNTLLLHRPLGFYSMKQTISTIYTPKP